MLYAAAFKTEKIASELRKVPESRPASSVHIDLISIKAFQTKEKPDESGIWRRELVQDTRAAVFVDFPDVSL